MSDVVSCLTCGGRLAWFPQVEAWRHTWVPDGTAPHPAALSTGTFTPEIEESDRDTGQRITATRAEVEARGRAMREALGAIEPYVRPATVLPAPPGFEMRTGVDVDGKEFTYPWLLEPTWINADGWPVRVSPGTGAKSAAKVKGRLTEHPAPEITARPATEEEVPAKARLLAGYAADYHWDTDLLYARGYKPDVHRRASHTKLVDVVVLRGWRHRTRERFVGCWVDGKFDLGYHLEPGNTTMLSSTELTAKVQTEVMVCADCGIPASQHEPEEHT